MCGRITVRTSTEDLLREFNLSVVEPLTWRPRYNLAPTQPVPVVANTGERLLEVYRWGLVPSWAKDVAMGSKLINARADTLTEKPSFRSAFKKRRCLLLVDGFYEWRTVFEGPATAKAPFHIHRKDGRPFAIAGLWEEWQGPNGEPPLRTCALVTTEANALMRPLHDRMPVLLPQDAQALWLTPGEVKAETLTPLLVPYALDDLEAVEVSRLVNSPRNDRPECLTPVAGANAPPAPPLQGDLF